MSNRICSSTIIQKMAVDHHIKVSGGTPCHHLKVSDFFLYKGVKCHFFLFSPDCCEVSNEYMSNLRFILVKHAPKLCRSHFAVQLEHQGETFPCLLPEMLL